MKKYIFALSFFLQAILASADDSWKVEVNRVIDGDTLTINDSSFPDVFGKDLPIRINGIDTASIRWENCVQEARQGEEARDMLKRLLSEAETVTLKNLKRGKFFRVVADVYVDGPQGYASVADLLLISGLALPYDGRGKKPNWCLGKL